MRSCYSEDQLDAAFNWGIKLVELREDVDRNLLLNNLRIYNEAIGNFIRDKDLVGEVYDKIANDISNN
jgi:hypothetical protein